MLSNIGERDLDGGGGLVGADECLVGGAAAGGARRAAQREQHGRQHRRLPAPVLAAQEVQPLVRHKREFLRMKNNERVRIW